MGFLHVNGAWKIFFRIHMRKREGIVPLLIGNNSPPAEGRGSPSIWCLGDSRLPFGGFLVVTLSWLGGVPFCVEVDEALEAFVVVAQGDAF